MKFPCFYPFLPKGTRRVGVFGVFIGLLMTVLSFSEGASRGVGEKVSFLRKPEKTRNYGVLEKTLKNMKFRVFITLFSNLILKVQQM